LRFESW